MATQREGDGEGQDKVKSLIDTYDALLTDQLKYERERKASFEQRGAAVVTASTGLATLMFAVASFVQKSGTTSNFKGYEIAFIVLSVVAFLAAAAFGLGANRPLHAGTIDAGETEKLYSEVKNLKSSEDEKVDGFRNEIVEARSEVWKKLVDANDTRSKLLTAGLTSDVVALFFVLVSVVLVLIGGLETTHTTTHTK